MGIKKVLSAGICSIGIVCMLTACNITNNVSNDDNYETVNLFDEPLDNNNDNNSLLNQDTEAKTVTEADKDKNDSDKTNNDLTMSGDSAVKNSDSSFMKDICGIYHYETEEGIIIFEFTCVDGKYYMEYDSDYDYGGAEIELIDNTPVSVDGKTGYNVKLYCFSGFSFMGEYWGNGYDCFISMEENGDICLSYQPFTGDENLTVSKIDSGSVHSLVYSGTENTSAPEIIGCYRYETDDEHGTSVYMEFTEAGTFTAVYKKAGYTVTYLTGTYDASWGDQGLTGNVTYEIFAFGGMPYEVELIYSETLGCPVLFDEEGDALFGDEGGNPPVLVKTEPGKGMYIAPGPSYRTSEVMEMYEEYMSY